MSLKVKPYEGEYAERINKMFGVEPALYEYGEGKCLLPPFYSDMAQDILDASVREDDVWLISYPRTGSTWCQEMIWLILHDLDFDTARNTVQQIRAPLIELSTVLFEFAATFDKIIGDSVEFVNKQPSPRCIKSHLPIDLLPTQLDKVKPKIIYTIRNPKDMAVSKYHHQRMFHNFHVSFEEFCEMLMKDAVPLGSMWHHYLNFWNKRHEPNVLIVRYEEMKKDLRGTIRKVAEFLEKPPLSEKEIDALCEFLSFSNMRQNNGCNFKTIVDSCKGKDFYEKVGEHFIRKGIVGDWRNFMSPELSEKMDRWIEENTRGTGLNFEY